MPHLQLVIKGGKDLAAQVTERRGITFKHGRTLTNSQGWHVTIGTTNMENEELVSQWYQQVIAHRHAFLPGALMLFDVKERC